MRSDDERVGVRDEELESLECVRCTRDDEATRVGEVIAVVAEEEVVVDVVVGEEVVMIGRAVEAKGDLGDDGTDDDENDGDVA